MILEIVGWIYSIYGFVFFGYTFIWNIIRLYHIFKNRKQLKDPKYLLKYYLDNYIDPPTDEGIQDLREFIEEFKKRQSAK